MDSLYLYSRCCWEWMGLDESELNLTLLPIEGHLIDGSAAHSEFEVGVLGNKLESADNAGIDDLIVDIEIHIVPPMYIVIY